MKDDILKLISVTKNSILMDTISKEITAAENLDLQKTKLIIDLAERIWKSIISEEVSSNITLTKNKTYYLQKKCVVKSGFTLTIPEGVIIETLYLNEELASNNYILVQQGAKINIEGTKENPVVIISTSRRIGSWAGLFILGKGKVYDENGEITSNINNNFLNSSYGGEIENDNSGIIRNLIIKHSGSYFNTNSNSISLYGVGSETIIENVCINSSVGGIGLIGGNVNINNYSSINCDFDAIFFDKGWSGTISNIYVNHESNFNSVINANGYNMSPSINNLYAVSELYGDGIYFNDNSGAKFNGLTLLGYEEDIILTDNNNVIIEGSTVPDPLGNPAINIDKQLSDLSLLDIDENMFIIPSHPDKDLVLYSGVKYRLKTKCVIQPNNSLSIQKNVKVEVTANKNIYLLLKNGSKFDILGTKEEPVVFHSSNGTSGSWTGIIILGDAPSYHNNGSVVYQMNDINFGSYGGENESHNAGIIDNLIIKHAGSKNLNLGSLNLYGVGHGTYINNLAIIDCENFGLNIKGGKATITNIFFKDCLEKSLNWLDGWSGMINGIYIFYTKFGDIIGICGDGPNKNPTLKNLTCQSSIGGTCMKFKSSKFEDNFIYDSGVLIYGITIFGYDNDILFERNNLIIKDDVTSTTLLKDFEWANV